MAQNTPDAWGGNHYLSCQARCRLDARLWLTCRLALAKGLLEEDSGIGKLAGSARSVTAAIGSCLHHCQQGLDEADAFGDLELAAEFAFVTVVHTLQQGKISDELLDKLEVALAHWLTYWSYFSMDWSMIDRLIHGLIGWLTGCWLSDWLIDWLLIYWSMDSLIDWLIDLLAVDWLSDWLIDWLIDWLTVDLLIDGFIDWLVDWLTGCWLTAWLIDWVIDRLTDCWFIDRWIHWLIGWLIYWRLIDWVIDLLNAWFIDWLVDQLIDWLTDWLIYWLISSIHWIPLEVLRRITEKFRPFLPSFMVLINAHGFPLGCHPSA